MTSGSNSAGYRVVQREAATRRRRQTDLGLPPQDQTLRIPNRHPADRDVLLPGTEFETCFYAREAILSLDTADAYGLLASSPTRGGEWRVQWRDIALVAGAAPGTKSSPAASSTALFARQLEQFESRARETRFDRRHDPLRRRRALQQAETALLAAIVQWSRGGVSGSGTRASRCGRGADR